METIHFHRMEKSILDIMQNILFVFHKKKRKSHTGLEIHKLFFVRTIHVDANWLNTQITSMFEFYHS